VAPLRFVLLALLALGACKSDAQKEPGAAAVEEQEQEVALFQGETIESTPYRFTLVQPGADWKLMERDDARKIATDAQAAMSTANGLTAIVIVEHVPGLTLVEMSTLIIDSMPIEDKTMTAQENELYVDLPAVRFALSGRVNDIPMQYEGRIFLREGYSYQVIAFAPDGVAKRQDWDRAFDSFRLSDGEIQPVVDNTSAPDMVGVGWRLKDGVFESAVTGLRISPQGGWRAVVGAEARRMNPDAEVALVRSAPDAYFLVSPEQIGETDTDAYFQNRVDDTAASLKGEVKRTSIPGELFGKPVNSTLLTSAEVPWTYQVSVAFADGWAVQGTGWYTVGLGETGQKAIADAMKSIARMPKKERTALRSELLASPDQQDAVGTAFSLRTGVFRDYENGLEWTKPKGFWELYTGQEVREINAGARLYGRYSNTALHFMLLVNNLPSDAEAGVFHDSSVTSAQQQLGLELKKSAQKTRIGSGPALVTDATMAKGGIEVGYRIVTAVAEKRGVQLHIWGVGKGIERHAAAAAQAVSALEVHARMPATEMRKGVYLDYRLGFSMEVERKYEYRDSTPPEVAGIGSFPTWGIDGKDWIGVFAIRAIEAGRDREWSMSVMEDRIRESLTKMVNAGEATKEETTLVGMPAKHLLWTGSGRRLDAYLIRRHQTIYALAATDADGDSGMIDKAIAAFRLID
jgi:hypothetical protein